MTSRYSIRMASVRLKRRGKGSLLRVDPRQWMRSAATRAKPYKLQKPSKAYMWVHIPLGCTSMVHFSNLRTAISILAAAGTLIGPPAVRAVVSPVPASAQTMYPISLCDKFCDGRNPSLAAGDRIGATDVFDGRHVALHFDDADNMAWASISAGKPGDRVWLDRSFDGGYEWSPYGSKLGATSIPAGRAGWRTLMYNLDQWSSSRPLEGVVRACGQTGSNISCTPWARTTWNASNSQR